MTLLSEDKFILICYKHSVTLHVPALRFQAVAVSLSLSLLSSDIYELYFVNRTVACPVMFVTVIAVPVAELLFVLTLCGRVTQICVFNTVKLGTSASSP